MGVDEKNKGENQGEKNKDEKHTNKNAEVCEKLKESLIADAPKIKKSEVPKTDESKKKVDEAIDLHNDDIKKAREAIIGSYIENETERVKAQRPLAFCIIALVLIQLLLFNGIVILFGCLAYKAGVYREWILNNDSLKYYFGTVMIEMIGMLASIVAAVFRPNHQYIMNKMISKDYFRERK